MSDRTQQVLSIEIHSTRQVDAGFPTSRDPFGIWPPHIGNDINAGDKPYTAPCAIRRGKAQGASGIEYETRAGLRHAGGLGVFLAEPGNSSQLPAPVASDKVKAAYKDGILTVTLPKAEEAKPKQIDVSVN